MYFCLFNNKKIFGTKMMSIMFYVKKYLTQKFDVINVFQEMIFFLIKKHLAQNYVKNVFFLEIMVFLIFGPNIIYH